MSSTMVLLEEPLTTTTTTSIVTKGTSLGSDVAAMKPLNSAVAPSSLIYADDEGLIYTPFEKINYQHQTSKLVDVPNFFPYQFAHHHPTSYFDYFLHPLTPSNVLMYNNCNGYSRRINGVNVRKPAKDMESLKMQIRYALAGTDQVRSIILSCTFQPREMAFTALINLCGKLKDADKAKEVFDTMILDTDLSPNTYTYSALISAYVCSSQIDKALEIFEEMKKKSSFSSFCSSSSTSSTSTSSSPLMKINKKMNEKNDCRDLSDNDCRPNHVTYCALVTACQRYGKYLECLDIYHEMSNAGYIPDKVTFLALISATESLEDWEKMETYMESLHEQKFIASIATYTKMLYYYASQNNPEKALKLFHTIQELGISVDSASCTALMSVLEKSSELEKAMDLIKSMTLIQMPLNLPLLNSAMRMAASSFDYAKCLSIFQTIIHNNLCPDSETLAPIIQSFRQISFNIDADELSTIGMKLTQYNKF